MLPSARTAELFRDIFNVAVSEGTLDTILRESAENLESFMRNLKEQMITATVAHFDETGLSQNGQRTRGRPLKGKARCLVERLDHHQDKVLAFMSDFAVPFDNNLVERDVRMAKLKQKISGNFRSSEMADAFCRIRSFISTVRKQGLQIQKHLESLFSSSPLPPLATSNT